MYLHNSFDAGYPAQSGIGEIHKVHKYIIVTHHSKRDLMGIAKSIDGGQPAQADHGRNFSLLADFLCIK